MTFDVREHLDRLRCRDTEWLVARRDELTAAERRIHVEKLAVLAVLDERRALERDDAARHGSSEATARRDLETARRLETVPEVAAAAHDGRLSAEQLAPAVELADEHSDREWAERAQGAAPADLARMARQARVPTFEEGLRRRAARRMWFGERPETGMVDFGGSLADVDGVYVKNVFEQLIERMRPAKGKPWDSRAHRMADVLVELCRHYEGCPETDRGGIIQPVLVVQVPLEGPAEVGGVPLPDHVVAELRANAKIEPVLVDDHGLRSIGKIRTNLSPKIVRAVLARDGHRCRHCGTTHGLHVHHLQPVAWGGTDDPANLAAVCSIGDACHPALVPHGNWVLEGNPNLPDGLHLVHWTQAVQVRPPPEWIAARRRRDRTRPANRKP
jgi:5-methylcytosine-specific restriction endonuclease McrA